MSGGEPPADPPGPKVNRTLTYQDSDAVSDGRDDATRPGRPAGASPRPAAQPALPVAPDLDEPKLSTISPTSYEFGQEFGRGGLGRVVRATDLRLRRPVAIKELLAPRTGLERRFMREAMITARLQHPGIVPVYEAGCWPSGEPFYAMRIIAGRSLGEALSVVVNDPDARLALLPDLIAASKAIAYAHSEGVIHRDLKPSNIMLGPFGETVVIDWGLAKLLDGTGLPDVPTPTPTPTPAPLAARLRSATAPGATPDPDATQLGTVLGTPGYMAPEQARGEPADARADVYALGAILYTLLAGQRPHAAPDVESEIIAVATRAPPPLEERAPEAPRELITICNKAMARDAAQRYANAGELAADLERFTTGQLVGAHRYGAAQLIVRFVRRHLGAVVASTVLLALLAVVAIISIRQIIAERERADVQRRTAEHERERAETRSAELTLAQARGALRVDPTAALAWLKQYPLDGSQWGAARQLAAAAESAGVSRHVLAHSRSVCCVLALPGERAVAGDASGALMRWDLAAGRGEVLSGGGSPITHIATAGGRLVWSRADGSIEEQGIDDAPGKTRTLRAASKDEVDELAVSPDGELVVARSSGRPITVWSRAGVARQLEHDGDERELEFVGGALAALVRHPRVWDLGAGVPVLPDVEAMQLEASADGRRWALGQRSGTILVGEAGAAPDTVRTLTGHTTMISSMEMSPDGRMLLSVDIDGTVLLWNVVSGAKTEIWLSGDAVMSAALSPDGRRVALATYGQGAATLWDATPPDGMQRLLGHGSQINELIFTDDNTLLTVADDQALRVWKLSAPPAGMLSTGGGTVMNMVRAPDDRWLAVLDMTPQLALHDLVSGERRLLEAPAGRRLRPLATDAQGRWLAAAGEEVVLYEMATGARRALEAPRVGDLAFSPDGRTLAAAGRRLHLWDVTSGVDRAPPSGTELDRVAFSPDGVWVASASIDGALMLTPVGAGVARVVATGAGRMVLLDFASPQRLVTLSDSGALRVWQLDTGKSRTAGTRTGETQMAVLSPDGRTVAAAGGSNQITVWDLDGGPARALTGHIGDVVSLAFSDDSRRLASGAGFQERGVRIWDLASGEGRSVHGDASMIIRVVFSGDGRQVFFGDGGGVVWRTRDDLPYGGAELRPHFDAVTSAAIGAADLAWTP